MIIKGVVIRLADISGIRATNDDDRRTAGKAILGDRHPSQTGACWGERTIFQSRGILSSTPSDGCPLQEVRKYPAEAELLRRNELQLRRRNVGNESRTAGY